ncbi:MAG: aminotransferase class I/II-fold pyridoxal phosphate-dependent enzyme [Chloroflexota bacterium]
MKALNPLAVATPHSGIREIVNMVVGRPDVLRLEIGQPSFDPPAHVAEAALAAARRGGSGYTASAGMLALRELLVEKLKTVNGIEANPQEVTVTVGAVGGISLALLALCSAGDEILVPEVAWPNYEMMAICLGLVARPYPCGRETGYLPDLAALDPPPGPRTKVLIINSPSNPAGVAFDRQAIASVAEFADLHDLWLISDDTYDQLIYEGEYVTPSTFVREPRVISAFSFSKTYAMPGWRVGYIVAAEEVSQQIQKLMEPFVSCAPSVSQHAAIAALSGPQDCVAEMRDAYRQRRDAGLAVLRQAGRDAYVPSGAFYMLLDIGDTGMDSRSFALRLLEEQSVAVAPGAAFGPAAEGLVRVCFAPDEAIVAEGLERLVRFAEKHSTARVA